MVTTNGITENEHAKDVNQNIILDDLFCPRIAIMPFESPVLQL